MKKNVGRPPKFDEKRRPVTVTLPERTLHNLRAIDKDRARAIVKATDAVFSDDNYAHEPVQLIKVFAGHSLILVRPSKALRSIPFLRLVEIAPMRNLLVFTPGTLIDSVEIALNDLLDSAEYQQDKAEYVVLKMLCQLIHKLRKQKRISTGELLFVSLAES